MTAERLMKTPVRIHPRMVGLDTEDRYGSLKRGFGPWYTVNAHAAPLSTTEDESRGDAFVSILLKMVLPKDMPCEDGSQVEYMGKLYETVGSPAQAVNARTGLVSHQEIDLRKVD